mgnify:CR=1 FL=1
MCDKRLIMYVDLYYVGGRHKLDVTSINKYFPDIIKNRYSTVD